MARAAGRAIFVLLKMLGGGTTAAGAGWTTGLGATRLGVGGGVTGFDATGFGAVTFGGNAGGAAGFGGVGGAAGGVVRLARAAARTAGKGSADITTDAGDEGVRRVL